MKPSISIASLLLVLSASHLYAQGFDINVPGPDGSIPPVDPAAIAALDGETGQPKLWVSILPNAKLPEGVDSATALKELGEQSLEECDLGWREHFDPERFRVQSWNRSIKSGKQVNGETQITVINSLVLTEVTVGEGVPAGRYIEVYRVLESGDLELVERKPFEKLTKRKYPSAAKRRGI